MSPPARRWWLGSALLIPLLCTRPEALHAQERDSTAFRAGQWAAEFALGGSFAGLGVQRFSTPTRAWVASVRGQFQDVRGETDSLTSGLFGVSIAQLELEQAVVTIGHRWYRPITRNVLQHVTVGALAGTSRETRWRRTTPDFDSRSVGGGAFADLGAMWMVTPRLSLGAVWTAQVTRFRATREVFPTTDTDAWTTSTRLAFGELRMQGALFF